MYDLVAKNNPNVPESPLGTENDKSRPIDVLNRKTDVDRLLRLISAISESYGTATFALNGKWGSGKTFVLEMLERELEPYIESSKYVLFHYNCWQNDYYDEPLMAIIAAMLDSLDSEGHLFSEETRKKWETGLRLVGKKAIEMIGAFAKAKTGIDLLSVREDIKEAREQTDAAKEAEMQFDTLRGFTKAIKNARQKLEELAQDQTLIIVVDELDRCLPEYAIKVMERLHHLFYSVKNVIVLISVDKDQLEETVKRIFGDSSNTSDYLKKFVDFEIALSYGSVTAAFREKYIAFLNQFQENDNIGHEEFDLFFSALFDGIDIRTQEHVMNKVISLHRMLPDRATRDTGFVCFEVLLVLFKMHYPKDSLGTPWIAIEGDLGLCHLPKSLLKAFGKQVHRSFVTIIQNVSPSASVERRQIKIPCTLPYTLAWYNEKAFSDRYYLVSKSDRIQIMEEDVADFKKLADYLSIIV